jgi:hypothetical protein
MAANSPSGLLVRALLFHTHEVKRQLIAGGGGFNGPLHPDK